MNGSRACRCKIWWWRWTMPTAACCTPGSSRRKVPPRPSLLWSRWCAPMAVSASSTQDRGSHFCQSRPAGEVAEEQHGQVSLALRALGIHQILARSPQARGRSERAFGTIQGRLPQELRHNSITDYDAANRYLQQHFIADFNRRFTVKPAQPESAFVKLAGVELELVLSSKH